MHSIARTSIAKNLSFFSLLHGIRSVLITEIMTMLTQWRFNTIWQCSEARVSREIRSWLTISVSHAFAFASTVELPGNCILSNSPSPSSRWHSVTIAISIYPIEHSYRSPRTNRTISDVPVPQHWIENMAFIEYFHTFRSFKSKIATHTKQKKKNKRTQFDANLYTQQWMRREEKD